MTESVVILGSTGSIGTQALEVCEHLGVQVAALAAGKNIGLLEKQIRRWRPGFVSVATAGHARDLGRLLMDLKPPVRIGYGPEGNLEAASWPGRHLVVAAMVGVAGLAPVMAAIRSGKSIALANKETLVAGGSLVMPLLKETGCEIYPVDSEHSAIWQCLAGTPKGSLEKIFLTASGGPFRGRGKDDLRSITCKEALNHPTWKMGGKITVDSATLMNKGLEVIEACWLFECPPDRIEVVIHPQSIIHSMVELIDGSVMAQMGFPDMKLPIQLALTWPERLSGIPQRFDPFDPKSSILTFERPDLRTFRLLDLAYEACRRSGSMPVVLNAANEAAVEMFLSGRIGFLEIAERVEACLDRHMKRDFMTAFSFDDMMDMDRWARQHVKET